MDVCRNIKRDTVPSGDYSFAFLLVFKSPFCPVPYPFHRIRSSGSY